MLVVMVVGCGDNLSVEAELDAAGQVDAHDPDAVDAALTACTPATDTTQPTAGAVPEAGAYCLAWRRLDGGDDPFPRYFDRADVTLTGIHWYASDGGGAKGYDTTAQIATGCLQSASFIGPGAVAQSEPMRLCWRTASEAHGLLTWRAAPNFQPTHWSLCLYACPP